MKKKEEIKISVSLLALILLIFVFVNADQSIDIISGHTYRANLESTSDTGFWSGMKIAKNDSPLSESIYPFTDITFVTGGVKAYTFPGDNFDDQAHYFAAMIPDNFSASSILIPQDSDLESEGMFNSIQFSDFYFPTDYDDLNDNPYRTFCCNKENVTIGGENYTAFKVELATNMSYYVFVYNQSGVKTPMFLVPFQFHSPCYNNTACYAQFMLPRYQTYNFFVLSKYPSYTYRIWIDGVETTTFENTAIPYNLTIEARYLYTDNIAPDHPVVVAEEYGHNLFVPYFLSGEISQAYSVGITNANGRETFIVAPTPYDMTTPENYSMYIAILREGEMISPETLNVETTDELVRYKKTLQPTRLYDNSKAAVNQMNQIVNALFKWLNDGTFAQVRQFQFEYYINNNTFRFYDSKLGYVSNPTLKTGAPNVIILMVYNNGVLQPSYTGKIEEHQGYLVFNPHNDNVSLTHKNRFHYEEFDTGDQFIITPTGIEDVVEPNLTLQIYDGNGNLIREREMTVDRTINVNITGVSYTNPSVTTSLKAIVNSMNSILYNLFYALN